MARRNLRSLDRPWGLMLDVEEEQEKVDCKRKKVHIN
jgi:hypothetical protein